MIGAKLSKSALAALLEIKKARRLKKFSYDIGIHFQTVRKLSNGGYTGIDKVKKVEAELKRIEAETATPAQAIIIRVAERKGVTVEQLLTERSKNRYGQYSDGELARYIAVHIIYKETRLSYRQIAAEIGYKNHVSVIDNLKLIGDLFDTNAALRHEVLNIQKSL